jgi:hypothetical protein
LPARACWFESGQGHQFSTPSGKDELVKLATRLIVEEALEGEASGALGRD